MGMFDTYRPKAETACPVCGTPLTEWQGKDGPCALFIWEEGVKWPVDQAIDDEEVKLTAEELRKHSLPEAFVIYSYDCASHKPIFAQCSCRDGIWSNTKILSFEQPPGRPKSR